MNKILKYSGYGLAGLLILISFYVVFNWKHVSAFPSIISAFYAKEFCSCFYVVKRDEAFCHNYARQYVPISSFENDQQSKKVTVSGLGVTTSVVFRDQKTGCAYERKYE